MDSFVQSRKAVQLVATEPVATEEAALTPAEQEEANSPKWQLKELKGRHKNICSLIAQGVPRQQVALVCSVTPEYVSMLLRQPLCMQYIAKLNQAVDVQLEALHGASVEAIGRALRDGTNEDALKAARLQMEATGRVGPKQVATTTENNTDKLEKLADRLLGLLDRQRGRVLDGNAVEVSRVGWDGNNSSTQTVSDGIPAEEPSQHGIQVCQEGSTNPEAS